MLNPAVWLYPVTLFVVMAGSVQYLAFFFSSQARWVFLLLLFGYYAVRMVFYTGDRQFLTCIGLYLLWCFSTTAWSEAGGLSLAKSLALFLVVIAMVTGGRSWSLRVGRDNALDYLLPTAWLAAAAAVLGFFFSPLAYDSNNFQGFVLGSNMFGSMMAMSFPWWLWRAYTNRRPLNWSFFWMGMPCLALVFIFMSHSRAAMLIAMFTVGAFIAATAMHKWMKWLFVVITVVILVILFRPDVMQRGVEQVVYKQSAGVFSTRQATWKDSWDAAKEGGWTGLGYGVSAGAGTWHGGMSAVGYGREKGNSQLAVIEETGGVGLSLYALVLLSTFLRFMRSFRRTRNPDTRVAVGIVLGSWLGMLAQSFFEGWWGAPGAPETVAFWALTGVGLGLSSLVDSENFADRARADYA